MACVSLWLLFISISVRTVVGQVPSFEKESLTSFYDAMDGLPTWNLNDDPCEGSWEGISCSVDNSTITRLDLGIYGVSGQLPSLDLPNLTHMLVPYVPLYQNIYHNDRDLRRNLITGTLPDSWSSLTSLMELLVT